MPHASLSAHAHPLGRIREHDPKSWNYRNSRRLVRRRNVTHRVGPHLNQADLGSCEGNTGAEWANWTKAVNCRKALWTKATGARKTTKLDEAQAVILYSLATLLDDKDIPGKYPPNDTGTTGLGMAKAMVSRGLIKAYNWTFDFESFLAQLQLTPVMLGTDWYAGMMEVGKNGLVAPAPTDTDADGGHAYLAHAVDFRNARVGCTNHWVNDDGTPWGVKIGDHPGSFWIEFDVLERLLIEEKGEALVPVLL